MRAALGEPRQRHPRQDVAEAEPADQERAAAQLGGRGAEVEPLADRLLVYSDDGDATAADALSAGLQPATTLVRRSSLEDVFLRLTGRRLDD